MFQVRTLKGTHYLIMDLNSGKVWQYNEIILNWDKSQEIFAGDRGIRQESNTTQEKNTALYRKKLMICWVREKKIFLKLFLWRNYRYYNNTSWITSFSSNFYFFSFV